MPLGRPFGLLVVLAVLGATALFLERQRPLAPSPSPLLGVRADDVVGIRIQEGGRELRAVRTGAVWRVEIPSAVRPDGLAAVASMVEFLTALTPVDTFERPEIEREEFGLEPARARIELDVGDREEPLVLLLGDYVPTGGSVYGGLASERQIHQIGALVVSEMEKVFYLTSPAREPRETSRAGVLEP
jgi:hypothetical protein